MAIFKNDFLVGLAKPIEIVLIDEGNGCEVRLFSERVSIKDGEYIAAHVRDLPKNFIVKDKNEKRPTSEKEAILQAIGGEPFLSMLALADWLEENGQRLEDRFTAEGLRLMVEQGRQPLKRCDSSNNVLWAWMELGSKVAIETNSAYLPKHVYRTLVMKNQGRAWSHGRQSAIVDAALAYGLVANGKGVPEFTEKETLPVDPTMGEYATDFDHDPWNDSEGDE